MLKQHVCNGLHECSDHSDELQCEGVERPCLVASGSEFGKPCVLPFSYYGFEYSACTMVDAFEPWALIGPGRCELGLVPSVSSRAHTLSACQAACLNCANQPRHRGREAVRW